jgi:cytoskeletal protein RodZ
VTCLKEIGEYLHRVREEKHISLKEVQEATKISMRYLEAIDRGDFDGIPGEVYRKGFLVNFANAIGLNGQEILQRYNQLKTNQEEQLRQAQNQVAIQQGNISHALDNEQLKGLYLGIVVALIGILIVASFFLFPSYRKTNLEDEVSSSQVNTSQDTNENTGKLAKQRLPAPITINALFKERTWVQIKSDGDYLYGADGMTFDPAQPQQVWTAQKELVIKMGNPAGVSLSFNGKELGQLGERGSTKTVKFSQHGLEAL